MFTHFDGFITADDHVKLRFCDLHVH